MKHKTGVLIGLFSVFALAAVLRSMVPVEQAKLTAHDGTAHDIFGEWVSISGDTVILSAYLADDLGTNSGAVYIFQRGDARWKERPKLLASDGAAGDQFGFVVSIDGDRAVIGARHDDQAAGSAYIFERQGTEWIETAKLLPNDRNAGAEFGYFADIQGDTVVVGARLDDDRGTNSGSVYIFEWSGLEWNQAAKITASDGRAGDEFGFSTAIDGNTIVVGSRFHDRLGANSGAVYVLQRQANSWSEIDKLTASDGQPGDNFGLAVNLDGDTIIASAPGSDDLGSESGALYVFSRNRETWTQIAKLTASDGGPGDRFGEHQVAVKGDNLIVSAYLDDDSGTNSGAAYLFQLDDNRWTESAKLTASDGEAGDYFGLSVDLDGGTIVLAASLDDDQGTNAGAAYIFELVPIP